ncbi:23S rRNA (uracil(1939)-C(5))-methyltransferase RlmD [Salinimonas sp. HHU 13199]|uniref:23S rRNA (Uracil(1939)-C(5))-methyltransferase RlmD n=1 Tax=Salinimonas profundi TaxID=2729140 RepID=A0ABR8LKP3_9ALTE|nr:23S rRNA (uracil(1939)-C(5))-methyltransferase RlmD [Salinimonas profundi]MBD3585883.1 23S rRNA (uracil(1939)-C(5))-methyltransferase RlmD [Salinimonas profundi]
MVSFYKPAKKSRKQHTIKTVTVESLDMHGVGVSRSQRPVMFVEGALPGEQVQAKVVNSQKQVSKAVTRHVVEASPLRVEPFCQYYGRCGGCQLQHISAQDALSERQQAMSDYWAHHLNITDLPWQPAITGARPAYRRKARFAVDARNPKALKIGFRQTSSKAIVDIETCPVLEHRLQALMPALRKVLTSFSALQHIGHIQALSGDNVAEFTIKATRDLPAALRDALVEFAVSEKVNVVIENAAGEIETLHREATLICKTHDGFYLTPTPNDFVQVNAQVNEKMVSHALNWLAVNKNDTVADWFAGLGNFSLPLSSHASHVYAVEGVAAMVEKGQAAAQQQGIDNITWQHLDLSDAGSVKNALGHGVTKILLDPSREGAAEVCRQIAQAKTKQVLYVSCNPNTFTRDARIMLDAGYKIEKIGLIEMFPYTRHLEVMALLSHATH